MKCLGRNLEDHCCYVNGEVCQFLEENTEPGYRWSCGLRRELGDWDKVLADLRYVNGPGAHFSRLNGDCKSSPNPDTGERCTTCGANIGDC